MTIIYMDENMKLAQPVNENQEEDRSVFCGLTEVGQVIDGPLNPIIYSTK